MILPENYTKRLPLAFRPISYIGHQIVHMPPDWKNFERTMYTLIFVDRELLPKEYRYFFQKASKLKLVNPRVFTPRILEYASLFHPCFFYALSPSRNDFSSNLTTFIATLQPKRANIPVSENLKLGTGLYHLQSLIFLSGVTLSAAIIQNRWSQGTIESKLNRLWQASSTLRNFPEFVITPKAIQSFVLQMARELPNKPKLVLRQVKVFYSRLLRELVRDIPSETKVMTEARLDGNQKKRFGFVEGLKGLLGNNIETILLYGSATNSTKFADYDLIIVVRNLTLALEALEGKSPTYQGIELNISVYGPEDFWSYQLASGDNLYDHGICLYGKIAVPHQTKNDLLVRNFSFGFIRFRQLMGMGPHVEQITTADDDKRNLLDYFIKIPLNIAKGFEGSIGRVGTNEHIENWAKKTIAFDVDALKSLSRQGDHLTAISHATWAAQEVLNEYNKQLNLITSKEALVSDHIKKIRL